MVSKGMRMVLVAVICSALDMSLTLVGIAADGSVFSMANIGENFANATPSRYDFRTNPIDFFITSLMRVVILLGGATLLAYNPAEGPYRLRKVTGPVFGLTLLLWAFSPTKLLAFAEKGDSLHVGEWFCIAWNFIAALILHLVWNRVYLSGKAAAAAANGSSRSAEQTRLIGNEHDGPTYANVDDEAPAEDVIVKAKETFELMARLLQYCRREWLWHLSGFTWLFLYSLSKRRKLLHSAIIYIF